MSLRQVSSRVIVNSKVMAVQAGIADDAKNPITTRRLEAHYLAGGDVPRVVRALIAAHRADIDLDFDRAAAIDLAGRDVLDAVQTSVNPKVIDCPGQQSGQQALSAIAGNGVELKVHALVTVRTDISKLIGGATEDTVIARVGEGIITAIGSADSHETVLENPDVISKAVLARGLDAQTAFQIVSIDIKSVVVGANIGARIQYERAEAETRVARARAEQRRAVAVAVEQEGRARTAENRAALLKSESLVPLSIAQAVREHRVELGGSVSARSFQLRPRRSMRRRASYWPAQLDSLKSLSKAMPSCSVPARIAVKRCFEPTLNNGPPGPIRPMSRPSGMLSANQPKSG
jgi:uncharacterized protein YqfA (UPF0365 family)